MHIFLTQVAYKSLAKVMNLLTHDPFNFCFCTMIMIEDHDRLMIMASWIWGELGTTSKQKKKKKEMENKQKTKFYSKYTYNMYLKICVWLLQNLSYGI